MDKKKFLALFMGKTKWRRRTNSCKRVRGLGILSTRFRDSEGWSGLGNFVPLEFKFILAEMTSMVDYRCGFKGGTCKIHHSRATRNPNRAALCCCVGCYHSMGYMMCTSLPKGSDVVLMASLFDEETGYWRKGVGCALPRRLRSPICLRHNCAHGELNAFEWSVLNAIGKITKAWEKFRYWCTKSGHKIECDQALIESWLNHEAEKEYRYRPYAFPRSRQTD